jgi:polysaccharide export outer membrane protein
MPNTVECNRNESRKNSLSEYAMRELPTPFLVMALFLYSCTTHEATRGYVSGTAQLATPSIQTEIQSNAYVITKGDQIQLSVWGYPEFTTNATVKEAGTIAIPLIGEVIAAGLTKEQFTQQIRQKLSVYIKGEMNLTVVVVGSVVQKVTVLGSVVRQESYPVLSDISLLDILSMAGGATIDSDLRHIKVIRHGEVSHPIEVDLTGYMESGNLEGIPILHPGDTVFVPKKENILRELSDYMRDLIFLFGFFGVFR